jgi:outer membrane protein assembly factor BamB
MHSGLIVRLNGLPIILLFALFALTGCFPGNVLSGGSAWGALVVEEEMIYVGTQQGHVLALNADNGNHVWAFAPDEDDSTQGAYSPPVVNGENLFVGGYNGELYNFNRQSGALLWRKTTGARIVGGPAVSDGKVVVGSTDGVLYAFSVADGGMQWSFPPKGEIGTIWSTPVISDGIVVVGSMDKKIYGVSLEDGRELWQYETNGAIPSTPLVIDDIVVAGSFDRTLYALDIVSGLEKWSVEFSNWIWAGATHSQSLIYVADLDGNVRAFTAGGLEAWSFRADEPIVSKPVIIGEVLVVAASDGRLYFLSKESGLQEEIAYNVGADIKAGLGSHGNAVIYSIIGDEESVQSFDVRRGIKVWETSTKGIKR